MTTLPIHDALPPLEQALQTHTRVLLTAPPGAGKSTVVPLTLLNQPWLKNQKILMLQPRRVAARMVAARMATSLNEKVGHTVGYRVALEARVSAHTRIEVITEGLLTRRLQNDPELSGVGLVIFDEFHERSLHADTALALALDAQNGLREDLKILVMSATLDEGRLARELNAPVVRSEGRMFPVSINHLVPKPEARLEHTVARAVQQALSEQTGDILVFLPGVGEIARVAGLLSASDAISLPLHGQLTSTQQDAALAPAPAGTRKVVLATSIAQTSLTIDGIKTVIDSGLTRKPVFDPVSGMTRLTTVRVSRATAEQRAGRAGRVSSGACYRLWASSHALDAHDVPEILEADLAPLALELAAWGVQQPQQLFWLDVPPPPHWAQAVQLLQTLGTLNDKGSITPHGKAVNGVGAHPRLAHALLGSGCRSQDSALLAALLNERDIFRNAPPNEVDLDDRLRVLHGGGAPLNCTVDRGAVDKIKQQAKAWALPPSSTTSPASSLQTTNHAPHTATLVALAYPDRIAQRRAGSTTQYLLANGRGAVLPEGSPLAKYEYLAVAQLDGNAKEARIYLAAAYSAEELRTQFADTLHTQDEVTWDAREGAVKARRLTRLGALILDEKRSDQPSAEAISQALCAGIRQAGLHVLPWDDASERWLARARWVQNTTHTSRRGAPVVDDSVIRESPTEHGQTHRSAPTSTSLTNLPNYTEPHLLATLETWLAPYLTGCSRLSHLSKLNLLDILQAPLDYATQQTLNTYAPTHITVPSGSSIRLDYSGHLPVLAVRIQEVFGMKASPTVAGGTVPVLLHLLSPGHKPVQVTQDLASFWRSGYAEVKKDLKGRYPRHYWPDDPLIAEPRRGVRR